MLTTSESLLADIRLRGSIPNDQTRFSTATLLSFANSEILSSIIPLIVSSYENFYEFDVDTSVNATGKYQISSRAYSSVLVNVALVNSNGDYLDLTLLSEEEQRSTIDTEYADAGFIIKRNTIHLRPIDALGYPTLRQTILLRPCTLVASSSCAQITGISSNVLTFTSGTIPSTWTTSNTFDLIQANSPFDHLDIDLTASSITSTQITLSQEPNSSLQVGDYISLSNEGCVLQLPDAFHYLLSQRVANIAMRNLNRMNDLKAGEAAVKSMEESLNKTIQPRVQREKRILVNRTGMLRRINSFYRN